MSNQKKKKKTILWSIKNQHSQAITRCNIPSKHLQKQDRYIFLIFRKGNRVYGFYESSKNPTKINKIKRILPKQTTQNVVEKKMKKNGKNEKMKKLISSFQILVLGALTCIGQEGGEIPY